MNSSIFASVIEASIWLYFNKSSYESKMKWNAGVIDHFFLYEGWTGPGTAWANEVKFLWKLPQSSIKPAIFYSESNAVPQVEKSSFLDICERLV